MHLIVHYLFIFNFIKNLIFSHSSLLFKINAHHVSSYFAYKERKITYIVSKTSFEKKFFLTERNLEKNFFVISWILHISQNSWNNFFKISYIFNNMQRKANTRVLTRKEFCHYVSRLIARPIFPYIAPFRLKKKIKVYN